MVIDTAGTSTATRADSMMTIAADSSSQAQVAPSAGIPAPVSGQPVPLAPIATPGAAGSSNPSVVPADIPALRRQAPAVPVAGVAADKLVDSFDEMRGGTRRHNAIDIMAARNTPVVSVTAGRVLKLHNSVAGGLTLYASDATNRYIFMYGHLDSYRPGLVEGATLKRGEVIGFVGSTGNANPLGPHLHFVVTRSDNVKEWWKGTPINPYLVYRE